jgi:hypothetical protein
MRDRCHLRTLACVLAVLAFMLLAHPYQGVFHDGVLYMGQALLHGQVPGLSHDMFFVGGSQDRYSIYSRLVAPLYEHLGRLFTHVSLLLTSWLLTLGAVWVLLRRFEPAVLTRLWGVLAFAVMSPIYGGDWIISYSETFVTARSFAEPALLWGLVALLNNQRRLAFVLQMLGALFHPLIALPMMAVSWFFLARTDRRWLWLLAGVPVVLMLAVVGISPWDGLLKTYPPYWWSLVETRNSLALVLQWAPRDHLIMLQDVLILWAVIRLRPADPWTRLLWASIVAMLALLALSILGADALHSVLLTQLQLWRVHWVPHLLAMTMAPWLVFRLWQRGGLWQASASALILTLVNAHIGTGHGLATLSLWGLTSLVAWRVQGISKAVVRLVCISILLCALALSAYQLNALLQQMSWYLPRAGWVDRFAKIAAFPVLALGGFAALQYIANKSRGGAIAALGMSALLMTAAASTWDQRTDLARAVEEAPAQPPHPFIAHLPANASVYWPKELAAVWGLLERPSHYSQPQGAGVLFNRDTGLLFGSRNETYRRINEDREQCLTGAQLTRDLAARRRCEVPSLERLTTLCSQLDAPDFVVLRDRLTIEPIATWRLPDHRELPQTYALYACSRLKLAGLP